MFKFDKNQIILYKSQFTEKDWSAIIAAFPGTVPETDLRRFRSPNQTFVVEVKKTNKESMCATCKQPIRVGNLQAKTEGPHRTFNLAWIKMTFYYCPSKECTKVPRNPYIITSEDGFPIIYDEELTHEQRAMLDFP